MIEIYEIIIRGMCNIYGYLQSKIQSDVSLKAMSCIWGYATDVQILI